jgi:phosphate transport system substrate-binding protein
MISSTAVRWRTRLSSLIAAALALTACVPQTTQPETAEQQAVTAQTVAETKGPSDPGIKIDGSSTVYPITERVVSEFRKASQWANVAVDVRFSGTTAGFRQFCAGEIDISDASRPILLKEIEACNKEGVRFIELPIAFDALTVAVNPQNTWADNITIAELEKIWAPASQGKITRWNQVRPSFPDRPLTLFGAGKDSGTFDYFNEVVTGKPKESRTDYTDSEDDNVLVEGIAKDPNALGYMPFAYYEANQNRLKGLAIDSGKGAIMPSRETVEQAKYQPFSRPLFIYVNFQSTRKPEVRAFIEFYLKNARNLVATVGYIPLPEEGYHLASVQFYKGEVGTVFEGVPQPDVTIAELLRRQAVFQLTQK